MADKCWLCEGKGTYFDEGTFPCPECNIKETKGYMVAAARIAELEAEVARYQKALDGLTIAGGGSNMHGDPEYQAQWVQDRHTAAGKLIKKKVYRIRELEAALADKDAEITELEAELAETERKLNKMKYDKNPYG